MCEATAEKIKRKNFKKKMSSALLLCLQGKFKPPSINPINKTSSHITSEKMIIVQLFYVCLTLLFVQMEELYGGRVDDVDVYVGGMLESVDGPGPLFSNIILEQFQRLRDADRFWFENTEQG